MGEYFWIYNKVVYIIRGNSGTRFLDLAEIIVFLITLIPVDWQTLDSNGSWGGYLSQVKICSYASHHDYSLN